MNVTAHNLHLFLTDFSSCRTLNMELAHEDKNLNLRAAMIHVIGDLVQSIGVFLAAVLIKVCVSL